MSKNKPTADEKRKTKLAYRHLNQKLKLEKQLAAKIRRYLKKQSKEFRKQWETYEEVNATDQQRQALYRLLEGHYEKAAKKFTPDVIAGINDALREAGEAPVQPGDPSVVGALLLFIRRNVTLSTGKISDTSEKEFGVFVEQNDGSAKKAAAKMRKRAVPRSQSIGTTETQKAVEGSKFVAQESASSVGEDMALLPILFQNTKTWFTMMDGKVRSAHDAALFDQVAASEPFIVGGERLMFPGDYSLGASLWNIIHCRCVAIYEYLIRRV